MYMYMYVCMYVCVYIYIYIYIYNKHLIRLPDDDVARKAASLTLELLRKSNKVWFEQAPSSRRTHIYIYIYIFMYMYMYMYMYIMHMSDHAS